MYDDVVMMLVFITAAMLLSRMTPYSHLYVMILHALMMTAAAIGHISPIIRQHICHDDGLVMPCYVAHDRHNG